MLSMTMNDDEWRAEKFSEEELIGARLLGPVSFAALKQALERHGPDGILESAVLLPRKQYEALEALVRKAPKARTVHRRRRR